MDCTVPGILQARILEWVPFPFCRGSSQPRDWTQVSGIAGTFFTSWAIREVHGWVKSLSRVRLFATPWIVAYQAPPSMGFSGKNTGVGRHFLLQEIFPTQGLNPGLPHCRQMLYPLSHQGSPKPKAPTIIILIDKLDFINIKAFCLSKDITRKWTGEPQFRRAYS